MTANGRRIKRRGSGRSGNSDELEVSPRGSAEGSEHVSHLLQSQKRVYEVPNAHTQLHLVSFSGFMLRAQHAKFPLFNPLTSFLREVERLGREGHVRCYAQPPPMPAQSKALQYCKRQGCAETGAQH